MASRRHALFTTVRTEGALLPPDLLRRILDHDKALGGLDPENYHLVEGERLGEAISRSWNRLQGVWTSFRAASDQLPEHDLGLTITRQKWLLPLFFELGYGRLPQGPGIEVGDRKFAIYSAWGKHFPIHLTGLKVDLDKRMPGVAGAAKSSPHGMVQELLNASDDHLWGVVSNGARLRLLRDNHSLARPAYAEFDLWGMMEGEVFSDFVLLWLLTHQSRVETDRPEECWLEKWSKAAHEQGTRALDRLRDGVAEAISALGRGFLAHPSNQVLREKLRSGALDKQDYYRQLLRLVYRLIFLFAAEDRELLSPPGADPQAQARYAEHYSTARLRKLAGRRRGTRHGDLYHALRLVMEKLGSDEGCPGLALPALGSFLWSNEALPDLNSADLANCDLLETIRQLAYSKDAQALRPVDYRNMGAEELGSVYESLLELHPEVHLEAATFELKSASGSERKTTGSYYTPDSLVQCLLDSALEPVVEESIKGKTGAEAEKAILALKVCDPAVGSGHFLVGAAHRLARHLARVRAVAQGESEPSPSLYQHYLRDVIGRCLYGVDINPMAAELCRVSLWLEALEPGRPLSFLDHHIRVGNSLLGTTPELIAAGLPDEVFNPIEGDDKKACAALKKRNKAERKGWGPLYAQEEAAIQTRLEQASAALDFLPDDRPEEIRAKELAFRRHEQTEDYQKKKQLADAWCTAFVIKKHFREPGRETSASGITQGHLNGLASGLALPGDLAEEVYKLSGQFQFFHWHLTFPEVFAKGGFDCIIGNPPWEKVQLEEKQFFEVRRPDIASATSSQRRRLLTQLAVEDPSLWKQWSNALQSCEAEVKCLKVSGRFPLGAHGNLNTYSLFLEHSIQLTSPHGCCGAIVPSGIATDDSKKHFFQNLIRTRSLRCLYDFENRLGIFQEIDSRMKFCLITISGPMRCATQAAEFVFFAHSVEDLRDPGRPFSLSAEDIALLNPNTQTCPTFRTQKDAELTKAIFKRNPVVEREDNPEASWCGEAKQMLNITHDSESYLPGAILIEQGALRTRTGEYVNGRGQKWLRLYEGKMVGAYDHRQANVSYRSDVSYRTTSTEASTLPEHLDPLFFVTPQFWVAEARVDAAVPCWYRNQWFIGFKRITSSTNERTMIAAAVPKVGMIDALPVIYLRGSACQHGELLANLNALVLDYVARSKVGGLQISHFIYKQLPAIAPRSYQSDWVSGQSLEEFVMPRVLELTYTAWDLEPFAQDCGWSGPPFRWDEGRRFLLRCELDAAFFHLYLPATSDGKWRRALVAEGAAYEELAQDFERLEASFPTPREAVAYIIGTFPIVKRKDEENWGEFRTQRVILEIYDALQDAIRTGQPYQTCLDPPPADTRCCHPPREEGK